MARRIQGSLFVNKYSSPDRVNPMAIKILKSIDEIDSSRKELRRMGVSSITPLPIRALRRLGILRGINVGDHIKSWDILETTRFLQKSLPKDAPILDIGAYASEILCVLHRLNYVSLTGVDLNPALPSMPHSESIRYVVSDFHQAPFPDGSFAAITAISVIEHGFKSANLLKEISRLLRPGGYFIASFDYWPEKISTHGVFLFGEEWTIFSGDEMIRFIEDARSSGFSCEGNFSLDAGDKVIRWGGREYTFGWMALRKDPICAFSS